MGEDADAGSVETNWKHDTTSYQGCLKNWKAKSMDQAMFITMTFFILTFHSTNWLGVLRSLERYIVNCIWGHTVVNIRGIDGYVNSEYNADDIWTLYDM